MYRPGMACELEAGIVGRDLDALCNFYTRVMGFTLVERLDAPAGTVCKLRRDAARLKLFKPAGAVDPVAPAEPWFGAGGFRYAALYLEHFADVDALAAATGHVLIEPTNHRPGARMALVCDPEGNVWELLAEHE